MSKNISLNQVKKYQKEFESCSHCRISMNALTRSKLDDVTMDWDSFRTIDHNYSNIVKHEMPKVTNQKGSGRCWGFAALNLMRIEFAKKYNFNLNLLNQINVGGRIIYIEKIDEELSKAYKMTKYNDNYSKDFLFDVFSNFYLTKKEEGFIF